MFAKILLENHAKWMNPQNTNELKNIAKNYLKINNIVHGVY